jgi:hypothetical protein
MTRIIRLLDLPQAILDSRTSSSSPNILNQLPHEIWLIIIGHLPAQSKISLALTNKHFAAMMDGTCMNVDIDAVLESGQRLLTTELTPLALVPTVFNFPKDQILHKNSLWHMEWEFECAHCKCCLSWILPYYFGLHLSEKDPSYTAKYMPEIKHIAKHLLLAHQLEPNLQEVTTRSVMVLAVVEVQASILENLVRGNRIISEAKGPMTYGALAAQMKETQGPDRNVSDYISSICI